MIERIEVSSMLHNMINQGFRGFPGTPMRHVFGPAGDLVIIATLGTMAEEGKIPDLTERALLGREE